ncbi:MULTISPECIES: hypothetical protein [Heyndrickxia]|uniref:Uncharacterized protein n=1 Tax=Heyndrickxia oleronia TaxID=38875 RepID=A0A8E2LEI8_9BACI|nr:hypothetical protein [Heyndrickxia oleronia]NYV64768.1 hypothetical protein [Bacillus sp. Gen3]OJH19269.1 hypothetical protein BLX88_08745 [Bacillus obstructivus]MBU5210873.1 hypothetical protein [Heyndrickxia oleronia]MCI1593241.1 hypothetical protein [Heyndrickxia oleronia]MCI1613554.1 hypothetical protein [Heyndrickxia oleronia]
MGIWLAIILLTYVLILVMSYVTITYLNENKEQSCKIINQAFYNAFNVLCFSILTVLIFVELPHITVDTQTTSYLILASKFLSILTLGCSIYVISRKIRDKKS